MNQKVVESGWEFGINLFAVAILFGMVVAHYLFDVHVPWWVGPSVILAGFEVGHYEELVEEDA